MKTSSRALAPLFLLALTACTLTERLQDSDVRAVVVQEYVRDSHAQFREHALSAGDAQRRRAAQNVDRPWVVGKALPLARELTLPRALQAHVPITLLFSDGPLELHDIAQRLTAATGIPVHVRPEALLPTAAFMPRLSQSADASPPSTPARVYLSGSAEPLAQILDRLAATLAVRWIYQNERIEFYRTRTRVFNIQALTLESRAEASLGASNQTSAQSGFSSSSRTVLRSGDDDVFSAVRARLEPFLSRAGIMVAQPGASGAVVVTDTPEVLDSIAAYLDQENRVLTRRIRLVFEELTLSAQDAAHAGVDWNMVFSSARVAAMASMSGATLADAGLATLRLAQGPFEGSEAMVAALSQVGKVVRRSSVPILSLNRRPVTHAIRTRFSYIDKVDTVPFSDGQGIALPSVSVSQKEETVGSVLTLVPDAQEDGRILLSIAYDNTVAQPIKTIKFGDRGNPLQLQQVTIDGSGTVQQVVLQPGQPMLISGFERSHDESERKRLGPGLPALFGGSDKAVSEQLFTVLIVTAHVEEGL